MNRETSVESSGVTEGADDSDYANISITDVGGGFAVAQSDN